MSQTDEFPLSKFSNILRSESSPKSMDYGDNLIAATMMDKGDVQGLASHLRRIDSAARDFILDFIHPKHWQLLGYGPLHGGVAQEAKEFLRRFKDVSPEEASANPLHRFAGQVGDYKIQAYVDEDGHLTLSVQSKDGSPVIDVGEDVAHGPEGEFAVRLTTGEVERQYNIDSSASTPRG